MYIIDSHKTYLKIQIYTLHKRLVLHSRPQIRVQGCLVDEMRVLGIRRPVLCVYVEVI